MDTFMDPLQHSAVPEAAFQRAFDLNSPLVYFPVRHHSPACTWHLEKTVAAYDPEIILIEGPSDANRLIPPDRRSRLGSALLRVLQLR